MILFDDFTDKTVVYGGNYILEILEDYEGKWNLYNREHPAVPLLVDFPSRRAGKKAAVQIIEGSLI